MELHQERIVEAKGLNSTHGNRILKTWKFEDHSPFLENKPARTQELKEQQLKMEKIFIEQEEVMRDAKEKGFKLLSL